MIKVKKGIGLFIGILLSILFVGTVSSVGATGGHATCKNMPECSINRSEGLAATPWFSPPGSLFYDYGSTFYYDGTRSNPQLTVDFRGSFFYNNPNGRVISVYSNRLGCNRVGTYCGNIDMNGIESSSKKQGVFSSLNYNAQG